MENGKPEVVAAAVDGAQEEEAASVEAGAAEGAEQVNSDEGEKRERVCPAHLCCSAAECAPFSLPLTRTFCTEWRPAWFSSGGPASRGARGGGRAAQGICQALLRANWP